MEKDVLESMPPAQRTSYEVSRRKALGMVTRLGLGGAAAAALGAGVGSRSVREALAAGGLPSASFCARSSVGCAARHTTATTASATGGSVDNRRAIDRTSCNLFTMCSPATSATHSA